MEDIIKQECCNFCMNKTKDCMDLLTESHNGVIIYKCKNYCLLEEKREKYVDFDYVIKSNNDFKKRKGKKDED